MMTAQRPEIRKKLDSSWNRITYHICWGVSLSPLLLLGCMEIWWNEAGENGCFSSVGRRFVPTASRWLATQKGQRPTAKYDLRTRLTRSVGDCKLKSCSHKKGRKDIQLDRNNTDHLRRCYKVWNLHSRVLHDSYQWELRNFKRKPWRETGMGGSMILKLIFKNSRYTDQAAGWTNWSSIHGRDRFFSFS